LRRVWPMARHWLLSPATNALPLLDRKPVTLSNLQAARPSRSSSATPRDTQRDVAAADVLAVQAYSRMGAALVVVMVQLAIGYRFRGLASPSTLLGISLAYVGFVGTLAIVVEQSRRATPVVVTLALAGDLAFIFAMTFVGTTPAHYERALFGSLVIIHLANVYFGQRQAWRVVIVAGLCYLALAAAAWRSALLVDRVEDLWTVAIGAAGAALIIVHAGNVRRRLRTIVTLFEGAEEGDFTQAYDEVADRRPDAITRVGRAYNRVRSQLASMVLTDPLTACLNRRGFDQALAREVARSARAGSDMALLALDLDHFKDINDNHGHLVGDEVLRAVGALLIQAGRAGDVVARIGGEEFAVILPDTAAAGAFQFASRLCDVMREHLFPPATPGGPPIRITTSIGLVSGAPEMDGDFAALFTSRADMALYAAKRSGRDRVRAWSHEGGMSGGGDVGMSGNAVRNRIVAS
jgi:diguanylate cyclase (GGDEF)-like protein